MHSESAATLQSEVVNSRLNAVEYVHAVDEKLSKTVAENYLSINVIESSGLSLKNVSLTE